MIRLDPQWVLAVGGVLVSQFLRFIFFYFFFLLYLQKVTSLGNPWSSSVHVLHDLFK